MNKQSLILYITLAILFLNATLSFGQCVVCVEAPPLITCGETATLTGDGFLTTAGFSDDFNSGIGTLWANISPGGGANATCTSAPIAFSNCAGGGVVPAGNHLWFPQGAVVPRQATTIGIPVPAGGDVIFEFKMEVQSAAGCDGPDLIGEGTMLQYLVAGSAIWQDMPATMSPFNQNPIPYTNKAYFCPTNPLLQNFTSWNQYTIPIPAAAFSANTQFRWRQISPTNQNWDFWGLENVNIVPSSPGGATYIWTTPGSPPVAGQTITVNPTALTSYTFTYTNNGISCNTTVDVDVAPPVVNPAIIPNPGNPCPNIIDLSADASFNSCNYKVYLYDNGGDGWNTIPQTPTSIDNRIEVYIDGILANIITMNGGYGPVIYSIPVTAGGTFETVFLNGGPNPAECAYFVEDNQGALINAQGLGTTPNSPWPIPAGAVPSPILNAMPGNVGPINTICPTTNLYNYSWTLLPGGSTAGISTPNSQTTSVTVAPSAQDYQVCIDDQAAPGCSACSTITVPGNPSIGTFDFAIISANPICDNGAFPTTTFELSSATISAGNFSFDLQEIDALGTVINTIPYPPFPGGSTFSFTISSPSSAGIYTYQIANLMDASGCPVSVNNNPLNLTVNQQVNPGSNGVANFCPNDLTGYDLSNYILPADNGGSWTLGGTLMANGLNFIFDPQTNLAGIYTYTVVNAPCPPLSATVTVSFFTLPPAPAAIDETACFGALSIPDLTAIGTNLTWYSDAALTNVVGNGSLFATGETTVNVYTYYVTETNIDGCEGPSTAVTLTIYALPAAPIAANQSACVGGVIPNLTAIGTALTWCSDAALTNIVGGGSSFATGQMAAGAYTYYVTQTDGNSCESNATAVTLTIYALPAAPIAANQSACVGGVIPNLTAIGTALTWYSDAALTNVVGNGSPFLTGETAVGTYTYYVTQTTNGCPGILSTNVTLTIHPEPAINTFTSSVSNISQGNPVSLTVDMAVGTPPFTINLADNNIPSNPYPFTITAPNMSGSVAVVPNVIPVTTYSITGITDGNGCPTPPSGLTVDITIDPYPIIDPFNTTTPEICYGIIPSVDITLTQGQVPVTVNYTYNGLPYTEVIGIVGMPVNIPLDTANLNNGINTITIISATDSDGDQSPNNLIPVPVEIIVNPNPVVTFGQDAEICFGQPAILEFGFLVGTAPFDVNYTINAPSPSQSLSFNASGTQSYTLTPDPAVGLNTYNMIQVTDAKNCQSVLNATNPVTIAVNPTPVLDIIVSGKNPICVGETSALEFPVTSGTAPYNLSYWAGTILVSDSIDAFGYIIPTGTPKPISPIITTDYTLYSVTDAKGCTNTLNNSAKLVVNELPLVDISATTEICYQNLTQLYFNFNAGNSPWKVYYTINGTPAVPLSTTNSADSITISPTTTTVYTVDSITDMNCMSLIIDAATVTVNPLPEVEVSGGGSVCNDGSEVNVIITTTSGTPTYTIEYTVGITIEEIKGIGYQYTFPTNKAGIYSVTKATDSKGCVAKSINGSATVNINPMPEGNIIAYPQPADITNPLIYFIDDSKFHVSGVWDFGDGNTSDTIMANGPKINHTFGDTGTYIVALELMTDSGCIITAYQTIIIDQAFRMYIPTAFTPNNDLYNDYFLPIVDGATEYEFSIYDRFGGRVFITEETDEAWDGKQNNGAEYAPAGQYIYSIVIVDFNGKERTYQGTLTLIR